MPRVRTPPFSLGVYLLIHGISEVGFYNTRLFKLEDGTLEVRQASADKGTVAEVKSEGRTVRIVRGDHSEEMAEVVRHLAKAAEYAANDNQRKMIAAYVKAFKGGNEGTN